LCHSTVDIKSISPNSGSMAGGTLITITGKGFKVAPKDIIIDIAGLPCVVQSNTDTEIVCKTSPAVAENLNQDCYAGKDLKTHFEPPA
jgi:IPT/TIG domain.